MGGRERRSHHEGEDKLAVELRGFEPLASSVQGRQSQSRDYAHSDDVYEPVHEVWRQTREEGFRGGEGSARWANATIIRMQ